MSKRRRPTEVFVDAVTSVEVLGDCVRVVFAVTQDGKQIPAVTLIWPAHRIELAAGLVPHVLN